MDDLLATISNEENFRCGVFGADDFIKYFPELLSTGVHLKFINHNYYIVDGNSVPENDTAFFTSDEMEFLDTEVYHG